MKLSARGENPIGAAVATVRHLPDREAIQVLQIVSAIQERWLQSKCPTNVANQDVSRVRDISSQAHRERGERSSGRSLSGLARNFGDVFELWSGGQCGVGVVVSGDALE